MPRAHKAAQPPFDALIRVADPSQLCGVQRATRALCRSAGFDEPAVFQAVIAVTEFAYRLLLERSRRVDLRLSALRHKRSLELKAEDADPGSRALVRVSFPFA